MDRKEFRRLYYSITLEEKGQTLDSIRPVSDNSLQGKCSPSSKYNVKMPNSLRPHLVKYIDMKHVKLKKVACRDILNWIQKKHAVYCSNHTLLRAMLDIGLP